MPIIYLPSIIGQCLIYVASFITWRTLSVSLFHNFNRHCKIPLDLKIRFVWERKNMEKKNMIFDSEISFLFSLIICLEWRNEREGKKKSYLGKDHVSLNFPQQRARVTSGPKAFWTNPTIKYNHKIKHFRKSHINNPV